MVHLYIFIFVSICYIVVCLTKRWILPSCGCNVTLPVNVKWFHMIWYTSIFNRCIRRFSSIRSKLITHWFYYGTWITLLMIPASIYFVFQSTFALFLKLAWRKSKTISVAPYIEPMFPGVNMPISDLWICCVALLTGTLLHELGHAIVAVRDGAHLDGIGFIVFFILPVAYTKIDDIEKLTPFKQLKIFCAGVWHNIVLVVIACSIAVALPQLVSPFYEYGNGVQIKFINVKSPLNGAGGPKVNDVLTKINTCRVTNHNSWYQCLDAIQKRSVDGYCLTSDFVLENDESTHVREVDDVLECCAEDDKSSKLCFEYMEEGNGPLEVPQHCCLRARAVLESEADPCQVGADCTKGLYCYRPSLPNRTRLMALGRRNAPIAIYLGHPTEIGRATRVSEFAERTALPSSIPDAINRLLERTAAFSGALAALNAFPCFFLDGQHITRTVVHLLALRYEWLYPIRMVVYVSITAIGTFVTVLFVVLAMATAFT